MPVMSIGKFERFFRVAASLDVDKADLKRYDDFVNRKTYDLLLRAQAAAQANGRDIIEPFDLPITKGLQERIHEFTKMDQEIEQKPVLEQLATLPHVDEDARGNGVGAALLCHLAKVATERGYGRIEWVTARENARGLDFYRRNGAEVHDSVRVLRLSRNELNRLAEQGLHV